MVEVKGLTKKYDGHTAVNDISFTLLPGKIYGLLGPNGAGKSTTMNMMTGYIAPSGGTVEIDGHDIYKEAKAAKRQIGYLPENPPVYQDMSVHEYLMFVAELKGVKKEERLLAVESVMEDTGVLDVADKLIRTLSKGYKQRVGFAAAIVNDPSVIILDEPTVGLDPKQIIEFRELIRQLGEEHIILLSSHILSEISAVCDHVFIINGGRLIVDDAVENLDSYAGGDMQLSITVKGDGEAAAEVLRGLAGIKEVSVEDSEDEQTKRIIVKAEATDENLTEQVSLALMEQRIPILGMQEQKDSLEQIFLEVTEEDNELAEDAAGEAISEDEDAEADSLEDDSMDETSAETESIETESTETVSENQTVSVGEIETDDENGKAGEEA
ncbi:MAG: ATP-binding cassette domain-containing protein [Lachnospiraceae bacterium]|nr:ATP-binding cassette domain-containing protein [Lachnospiraceae bacterium]